MLDDFTTIFHDLRGRTIKVWPIADVHIGSKECDLKGFESFIKSVETDEDSYVVLCGDIINNGVKDSLTNVYEETIPPSEQIELAVKILSNLSEKGKILGVVGGNHEARSRKAVDLDPMYQICCMLRIPQLYRQNMAFIRIRLEKNKIQDTYSLLLMHGKTANKKKQFSYAVEGIDAIITGHTHDGVVEKPSHLELTHKGIVKMKSVVSITATSWLNYGGYGAAGMYLPKTTSNPQCLELEFSGTNSKCGKIKVKW